MSSEYPTSQATLDEVKHVAQALTLARKSRNRRRLLALTLVLTALATLWLSRGRWSPLVLSSNPYESTPAENFPVGEAGLTLPEADAVDGLSAQAVADALAGCGRRWSPRTWTAGCWWTTTRSRCSTCSPRIAPPPCGPGSPAVATAPHWSGSARPPPRARRRGSAASSPIGGWTGTGSPRSTSPAITCSPTRSPSRPALW